MPKSIKYSRVGTHDKFENIIDSLGTLYEIKDSKLYIEENGGIYLVTSQEWVDYLIGNAKIPTEPYSKEELPEITTTELLDLIM